MSGGRPNDPEARRDTPLALKLKARIRAEGPMAASYFFGDCLGDPEFGYYRTQQAIGRSGDFVTAPEISQVFGELVGLWAAVVWQQMNSPAVVNLIEFGPGRGTLMADALRAARKVTGFYDSLRVSMFEVNPYLGAQQKLALAPHGDKVRWDSADEAFTHPIIVIANEFLDTEIGWHFIKTDAGWGFLRVGLDADDRLVFVPSDSCHASIV